MATPTLDFDRIVQAIVETPVGAVAKEAGAELVEGWAARFHEPDYAHRTLAVELGFQIWLDEATLAIGVQDRIARDDLAPFGCEWKSTKEPKRNKDGSDSAWWNEDVWTQQLVEGPQLAIYALALQRGTYFAEGREPFRLNVSNPRILVRAAVKSRPVRFWGNRVFQFEDAHLEHVAAGLRAKAASIRALRKSKLVPWQLTGPQCKGRFGYICPFFASICDPHVYPMLEMDGSHFDAADPAHQAALRHVDDERLKDPDLVVLSSSSYGTATECLERYRLTASAVAGKEENLALQTGTAMHAGLAAMYEQHVEMQTSAVA